MNVDLRIRGVHCPQTVVFHWITGSHCSSRVVPHRSMGQKHIMNFPTGINKVLLDLSFSIDTSVVPLCGRSRLHFPFLNYDEVRFIVIAYTYRPGVVSFNQCKREICVISELCPSKSST